MKKKFHAFVTGALATCALVGAYGVHSAYAYESKDDVFLTSSQAITPDGEVTTETKGVVTIEKTLAGGVQVVVTKVGQQPAVAKISIPGKDTINFDAYEPIETAPEEAREYLLQVWNRLGELPKKLIDIEIDTTDAPDAAEWARRAQTRVQYWYPKVVEMLDGAEGLERIPDDFKIRLVFKPMDGVAHAMGREITVSSRYIKARPDDFGLVIHETTHVAQAYPRVREIWAMEGMTDWIRYFVTEPSTTNTWRVDKARSKYTDSYGVTAGFYNWIVTNKDPDFIQKLHKVFRWGGSVELMVLDVYHTSLQVLWNEYIASLNY